MIASMRRRGREGGEGRERGRRGEGEREERGGREGGEGRERGRRGEGEGGEPGMRLLSSLPPLGQEAKRRVYLMSDLWPGAVMAE